jgi:thiamine biosynthesis lipoprotein
MKKRIIQVCLIIALIVIAYIRISNEKSKPVKETRVALGTFVTIEISEKNPDNPVIVDSAFRLIAKYEKQFSPKEDYSEIIRINTSASREVEISYDLAELLQKSQEISELTQGAFDVTIGAVSQLYDFIDKTIPYPDEIKENLKHVDFTKLHLVGYTLIKDDPAIRLDIGAIGKGFIVDKVAECLISAGIRQAAINAGGDLYVLENENGEEWRIGIQHPRDDSTLWGYITLKNAAVATSGDYEKFFMKDGTRIHHIIDPKTGLPADKAVSVTVIAPDATTADALCTAVFVMGPEKGIQLVNQLDNIEALIIYEQDGKLMQCLSDGFMNYNYEDLSQT